jgi:MraZ protein
VAYFQGQFTHTLDAKGRLTIPARFRELLDDAVVLARGATEACIEVYPLDAWRAMSEAAQALPHASLAARRFNRMRFGHSVEATLDSMGRVLLPPFLREAAGIAEQARVVGVNGMFEIWNPERFDEVTARDWAHSSEIFDEASRMGV